ncbi:S9 family peptidase [Nocardia sp. 348MFTsu5.1]|uniref:alpha/beta hydrolase family protein n=1 Tax=Nocardia sp. 348MFTsu5.1 TaxID=1172185 RepID=UPI00048F3EBD|nr:lipase family protein [Nocardia sp. 348MFTsu5.1]
MRRRTVAALVTLAGILFIAGIAPPASADDAPGFATPRWSGIDARETSAPIGSERGALIAQAQLDPTLSLPEVTDARRFLYATSRSADGPVTTSSAAVFLPTGTAPEDGWPVIAWAHGTTGLGDDCTPSALPRSERDAAYLQHWLRQGYAIVASDYAGLGTPGLMQYLGREAAARNIVDSVIAAHALGLPLAERWAIVGQSQGAGAALSAAHVATALSAGSGLDYRGVVATGTPAYINYPIDLLGPDVPPATLPAGLNSYVLYILAGFLDARPDIATRSALTPRAEQLIDQARILCIPVMAEITEGLDLRTLFSKPLAGVPGLPDALSDYMAIPDRGYDRPIFLGQGLLDRDVPAPLSLTLAAALAANGQPVTLNVYPKDHSGTVLTSTVDSTPWLARLMHG